MRDQYVCQNDEIILVPYKHCINSSLCNQEAKKYIIFWSKYNKIKLVTAKKLVWVQRPF